MATTTPDLASVEPPRARNGGANGASVAGQPLARTLGWLSVGLGAAEILAPRGLARWAGVAPRPRLLRALGARELATGLGILAQRRRSESWVWARVSGDLVDLGLLGVALRRASGARGRLTTATAAIAGVTALDLLCGTRLRREAAPVRTDMDPVRAALRIQRMPQELYRFWRELQNLPRFMQRLEAIAVGSDGRSRWRAIGPSGTPVEWDAEIVADEPNRRIAWCSLHDSEVFHCGSARFEPTRRGRGTLVRVELQSSWPGTGWLAKLARLLGMGPEQELKEDLRRFKQLMETGEIATTEGQSSGRARQATSQEQT